MSKRPSEDNVIYANFRSGSRVDSADKVAPPVRESTQLSYSAPAMRVNNAAVRQTDVGRVKRGREYAQRGHVLDLTAFHGGMRAAVVGSQNDPFEVEMRLPKRSQGDIDAAVGILARQPGAAEKANRGEYPDEVLDVLIADSPEEIRFFCDCPDGAQVCKHAVALADRAARLIDADPVLILTMRQVSLTALEQRKRYESEAQIRENAEPGSQYFWSGRDLPGLPRPRLAPMIEDSDLDLLHRAMQTISFTNIDQLRAVSDIEDVYDMLTRE